MTLGEVIGVDFSPYPNVKRWLDSMKKLPSWAKVNEVFYGLVGSLRGRSSLRCREGRAGANQDQGRETMSFFPGKDPAAGDKYPVRRAQGSVIVPRTADLGDGFTVRRALPSAQSRMVGPFVFFDHFGPAVFRSGNGLDVRPHPHIGLATVTYLFDGEIMHRDSLGTAAPIRPGEVNWMTAGRGIVHSERTGAGAPRHRRPICTACRCGWRCRRRRRRWRRTSPTTPSSEFPMVRDNGSSVRVVVGSAYGAALAGQDHLGDAVRRRASQGRQHAAARRRSRGARDLRARRRDRHCRRQVRRGPPAGVQARRRASAIRALTDAHFTIFGGAPMDGPRHIWWNFVSSRKDRIEQAKAEWTAGHFRKVPGDEIEFIPLPEAT